MSRPHPQLRWSIGLALVLAALLVVRPAQAAFYVCRGDPIVELSDGTKLTIEVALTVPATLVQDVTFIVHAPPGVTVKKVTYVPGALDGKEFVTLVGDAPRDSYRVETNVDLLLVGNLAEYLTEVHADPKGAAGDLKGPHPVLDPKFFANAAGSTDQILSVMVYKK